MKQRASFMEPEVEHGWWYLVDGNYGVDIIPYSIVSGDAIEDYEGEEIDVPPELADYCENRTCHSIKSEKAWGARLSAPGYLDVTSWELFATEEEVDEWIKENYEDEDEEDEDEEDEE